VYELVILPAIVNRLPKA